MASPLHSLYQTGSSYDFQALLFENDFKGFLPEIFLMIAAIGLLLYGVVYSTSSREKYPLLLDNINWLGVVSILCAFLLLVKNPVSHATLFYNTLIVDDCALFFKGLILVGTLAALFSSFNYLKGEAINAFEYLILLLLSTGSMLLLASAQDLISMYLAIELQSLCFYVMAGLKRNSEFSTEAGLKYFLLGAFSSGILLFGCSLIYGFTGITNFAELAQFLAPIGDGTSTAAVASSSLGSFGGTSISMGLHGTELGMILILVGFLFKVTAVPFHMWVPDVYEGAPSSVTAFFALAPKVSVFAVFTRLFLEGFYDLMSTWQTLILLSSLASMILGSLAALSQNKMKRLLAFSSIGHVGYVLIGLCCGTIEGLQAVCIYLVIYVIMTMTLFALVLCPLRRDVLHAVPRVKYVTDLALLARTNPALAVTVTITLFSMAGIPPLAGFYSKAYLFFAAMSSSMYLVAIVGVLTSVVSCYYYIRIVKIMYFESGASLTVPQLGTPLSFARIPKENAYILGIGFFFILCFILYPSPLYLGSHKVALALCS